MDDGYNLLLAFQKGIHVNFLLKFMDTNVLSLAFD